MFRYQHLEMFGLTLNKEPAMSSHSSDTGKVAVLRQVAAHRRFICIQNVILGNGQEATHRRLAAHKSGRS